MDERDIRREIDKVRRAISEPVADMVRKAVKIQQDPATQRLLAQLREASRKWTPVLAELARAIREDEAWRLPANWQGLDEEEFNELVNLTRATGWCLVGQPPAETVRALLAEDDPELRERLMLDAEMPILAGLSVILEQENDPSLTDLLSAAKEAHEVYVAGTYKAAQALANSGIASVVHDHFFFSRWKDAKEAYKDLNVEEAALEEVRITFLQMALYNAMQPYTPGKPAPSEFNRHASAHGVSMVQFSQINSLTALMLLVGFIRELGILRRLELRRAT